MFFFILFYSFGLNYFGYGLIWFLIVGFIWKNSSEFFKFKVFCIIEWNSIFVCVVGIVVCYYF